MAVDVASTLTRDYCQGLDNVPAEQRTWTFFNDDAILIKIWDSRDVHGSRLLLLLRFAARRAATTRQDPLSPFSVFYL